MTAVASTELASLIGRYLELYSGIQTLRTYAASGLLPESALPSELTDSATATDYLSTADGLRSVQRWTRAFASTFSSLDAAVREQERGTQFALDDWRLGVDAEARAVSSLVKRLESRAKRRTPAAA